LNATATVFGQIVTLSVGSWLVLNHHMNVGTLVSFLVLQGRLYGPIHTLAYARINLSSNRPVILRVHEMLHRVDERDGTLQCASGDVMVSAVGLQFGDRVLLENVDASVRSGEWIAIVGENGSGKSVMMQLLTRLLTGHTGVITLGGEPIEHGRLSDLRSRVVLLPPHDTLFSGTVRENVTYGCPVPDDAVWSALELVEIGERIRMDPEGLDAAVRPLGTELSSGERQRLALARAIVRQPDVLIVDESMSSIDAEAERRILTLMRERLRRSVIFISHRDPGMGLFDRKYRLQDRTLVQEG
jgi:ATP-binding cassette subfamily B protein